MSGGPIDSSNFRKIGFYIILRNKFKLKSFLQNRLIIWELLSHVYHELWIGFSRSEILNQLKNWNPTR